MTDYPDAVVERLAKALWKMAFPFVKWDYEYSKVQDIYRNEARALLDDIAPALVQAEREECARVADERMISHLPVCCDEDEWRCEGCELGGSIGKGSRGSGPAERGGVMTWNFDMSQAPKGYWRTVTRTIGKNVVEVEEYVSVSIIAAGNDGVVTLSRWLPKEGRWNMFSESTPPFAWQPWPNHPRSDEAA